MPENFPLAAALSSKLQPQLEAIARGENCEFLERATPVTAELLRFWFEAQQCELRRINFHEGQRMAIAAIIYAHEILQAPNLSTLYENIAPAALLEKNGLLTELQDARHAFPKYCAKMATGTGKTWVLNALLVWQYLNAQNPQLGSGEKDARFTKNFLLVAPGLIVYDRLLDSFQGKMRGGERAFQTSDIFVQRELFIPENYRDAVFGFLQSAVCTKTDIGRKTTSGGVVAITNWHLLAGEEDPDFVGEDETQIETPGADVDASAVAKNVLPLTPGVAAGNSLSALDRKYLRGGPLQSLKDLPDLLVFNDEAHHIHELKKDGATTEVEWQKSLTEIAENKGRKFIQIDFSATPFNQIGTGKNQSKKFFPHIVVDFDLNSAMRAGLVKALALDKRKEIAALPLDFRAERDAQDKTIGLSEGQRVMLRAGLKKLGILERQFEEFTNPLHHAEARHSREGGNPESPALVDSRLRGNDDMRGDGNDDMGRRGDDVVGSFNADKHPKMMVVCEDTSVTPHVVEFLQSCGLGEGDVLTVDSNKKGEMKKDDWAQTRERLFDVDRHVQPKVIVSVLMLREGFDVNNICVIVPLRASNAAILLEQTVGRGLRLMWRGDEQIEEAKNETRRRMNKGQEPNNFFDVLFVVEHPAFAEFYDELMKGGLAVEVGEESDSTSVTGDVERVLLRDGYEEYDFEVPFIIREAEEELRAPAIDPLALEPCKFNFDWLKKQIGSGDRFHSHDAQTGTQYGDYRVDGGVMTATGYNDYLSRMTRRIAEALGGDITKSAKKYHEISRFPFLQIQLPLLTGWADAYIRGRLFGQSFAPLENENWRVLLLDDVAHHIASQFATALIAAEENQTVSGAEVIHRRLSEATEITVRASSCVGVDKCIYPKLPYPNKSGGLERAFMEWANGDAGVLAFCKIHEYQHSFLQRRYLKADGFPANYSPDFLVKTDDAIYIVETKSQDGLLNENVQRKQRSALTWCEQINALSPEQRANCEWHYVLLGESAVYEWRDKGAHVAELLEFARVREAPKAQGALSW